MKNLAQYEYMLFGRFANENWIFTQSLVLPCEMGHNDMKYHEVLV